MDRRTLAVLQPGYLPWLGFFDQMRRCDVFIYYDDVQFDKHGWRNRNRIKAPDGTPRWLTVPIFHSGRNWPRILDVEIDNRGPWARKHVSTLRHWYGRAPFVEDYLPAIDEVLGRGWTRLLDLDLALTELLCGWLGLRRQTLRASSLGISGKQSERLVEFCRHVGATRYLSGNAAQDYLDMDLFARHGIEVEWQDYVHPTYPQQHGAFVSNLSIVDLLFNCGTASAATLSATGGGEHT